jgi:AraC-like DNA-binding protein
VPADHYILDAAWPGLFAELGVDGAHVLRVAGLPDDLFRQPSVRLDAADYHRLWEGVEALADDPLLALRLNEMLTTGSATPLVFATLCSFASLSSPNLPAALERVGRFKALISPVRVTAVEEGDRLAIDIAWPDAHPPPSVLVLRELLIALTLTRQGTRAHIRPIEVTTTTSLPSPIDAYEDFLGCPLRPGPRNPAVRARPDAERPFLTSDEGMWQVLEPALRQRLGDLGEPTSTTSRVRAALVEALPSGLVRLDDIGRRLAVSKRTLQRRIEAEGTSFQTLLGETREALARHYLEVGSVSTAQIALLLGYDEPNSFSRAFKTWTGTTPDAMRRQHRATIDAGGAR